MKILALDLGKFNTMCCFFDTKTRETEFLTAATERRYLTTVFKKHKIDLVVMEACGPSGWIHDLAVTEGLKTLVCSTNEDAWKWSNVKRKTDKDDALKLARMASMNELQAVHVPSEAQREFRSLVKYRKTLDYRINKLKNTIRAWFVNHGISIDKGEKAWHSGRTLINSFRMVGKSQPTSVLCRVSINPVKPIAMAASPSVAIHWLVRSWWNAATKFCRSPVSSGIDETRLPIWRIAVVLAVSPSGRYSYSINQLRGSQQSLKRIASMDRLVVQQAYMLRVGA